jgi:hypothetical protein
MDDRVASRQRGDHAAVSLRQVVGDRGSRPGNLGAGVRIEHRGLSDGLATAGERRLDRLAVGP